MKKPEVIDAILAELAAGFFVLISVDYLNPSYLDLYYRYTLHRNADSSFDIETHQSDNDAGSMPAITHQTLREAKLLEWLANVEDSDLAKANVRNADHTRFSRVVPESKG